MSDAPPTAVSAPPAADPATPGPAAPEPPETVFGPAPGWQLVDLGELWRYRELVFFLALRDIQVRYKQTVLGAAWAVLQPLLLTGVFTLFLGKVAKVPAGDAPYPVFVYAGLLPWFLFATAVTAAGNSLLDSERLISKVYFPRLAVPLGAAAVSLVDFAVGSTVLAVLLAIAGRPPGWGVVLLPVVAAAIWATAVGVGTLLAALNVAYRDFRYVVPFLVQAWLFATPSIYLDVTAAADHPPEVAAVMAANPMTGLVAFFRAAVLGGPLPWASAAAGAAVGLLLLAAGCLYFRKVEDRFADII